MKWVERIMATLQGKLPGKARVECDLCDSQDVTPPRTCCDDCLLELGRELELGRPVGGARLRRRS